MALAQELATAYAEGDWDTARRISPLPEWDDATYEEGFAGLDHATVIQADHETRDDRVVLWLMEVAHETRAARPQTSVYCVRWEYVPATATIERVAGETLSTEPGTIPVTDAQRGAWACARFDEPRTESPALPSRSELLALGTDEIEALLKEAALLPNDRELVDYRSQTYICEPDGRAVRRFRCEVFRWFVPALIHSPDLWCRQQFADRFECSTDEP